MGAHGPTLWGKVRRRAAFNLLPGKSIEYIACRALNLGDQAIYLATAQLFAGTIVCFPRGGRSNWWKRSASMLGGGTLVGAGQWSRELLVEFEESLARTGKGFAFGTGVAELTFPADREAYTKNPSTYERWGEVLKSCHYVGVRGPRSQAALAQLGVECEVVGDPAASLVRREGFWKPVAGCLGINIGNGGGAIWGDRDSFEQKMGAFLSLAVRQGWKLQFFALMDDDIPTTERIAGIAGIRNPDIVRCYLDTQAFLEPVARCQAFIGFKLHSVILAMCAHVPSIMIEYRPKGQDFMASVRLEELCFRTEEVEPSLLLESLSGVVQQGLQLSTSIRERLEAFRDLQVKRARDLVRWSVARRPDEPGEETRG